MNNLELTQILGKLDRLDLQSNLLQLEEAEAAQVLQLHFPDLDEDAFAGILGSLILAQRNPGKAGELISESFGFTLPTDDELSL